jgi:hypothetical protein
MTSAPTEIAAADEGDWAEESWTAPSWQEAARQYHEQRPKTGAVAGRSWEETCRLADRKLAAERKTGRQRESATSCAAATTVEALAYQLRGGVSALREPSALRRISDLNESQIHEIAQRLTKERWGKAEPGRQPKRVPPWQPDEIEVLISIWTMAK